MSLTIFAQNFSTYQGNATNGILRIYCQRNFQSTDLVMHSAGGVGSNSYFFSVACTIANGIITVPQFNHPLPVDTDEETTIFTAGVYTRNGQLILTVLANYRLSASLGSSTSWETIELFSKNNNIKVSGDTYTKEQINELLNGIVFPGVPDGNKGDVNVTSSGNVWTVNNAAITNAKIATGVNATKIGAGAVDNTEFSYLDGATSNIQAQINGFPIYNLSRYANFSTALSTIGSTKAVLHIDTNSNIPSATVVPATMFLNPVGGLLTKTSTGTITFQGIGIADPESQTPMFSGFAAGDVTWTGSVWPATVSTELWSTGDISLQTRIALTDAALSGKAAVILAYPRTITSDAAAITSYHTLYFSAGNYPNTYDALHFAPFTLGDNTAVTGDPEARIHESGVVGVGVNQAIFYAEQVEVSGSNGSNTNITIEGLYFVGDPAQVGSGGAATIHLGNCINGKINYNVFDHTHGYNVFGAGSGTGNYALNCEFVGNRFLGISTQVCAVVNGSSIIIRNNYFDQRNPSFVSSYAAIDLEPNTNNDHLDDIVIEDNIFDSRDSVPSYHSAIAIVGVGLGSAKNITVRNNTIYGIDVFSVAPYTLFSGIGMVGVLEGYIYNNTLRGSGVAISVTNSRQVSVRDNEVLMSLSDETLRAITIQGVADAEVYNNHLRKTSIYVGTQMGGITEWEAYIPASSSGSALTFLGGNTLITYFRDFYPGLSFYYNGSVYIFGTWTSATSIASTTSIGTVGVKTFTNSDVTTGTPGHVTITGHGFQTGALALITSNGTRPTFSPNLPVADWRAVGLESVRIVRIDPNTISFTSLDGSTPYNITAAGSGTNTLTPLIETRFSNNTYWNNETPDGITLQSTGTSQILASYNNNKIIDVPDANYTVTKDDGIIVFPTLTSARTVFLLDATTCKGQIVTVKDGAGTAATHNITLDGNGSQTIDGAATKAITGNYGVLAVKSDGANWLSIATTTDLTTVEADITSIEADIASIETSKLDATDLLRAFQFSDAVYNNTAALANTNLSVAVVTGNVYKIEAIVHGSNAVKSLAMDFGGTVSILQAIGEWQSYKATGAFANADTVKVTSLGTDYSNTGLDTLDGFYKFEGEVRTLSDGTFILRAAQRTADVSNTTLLADSNMVLTKVGAWLDPDAALYIGATGITDATIISAVNQLCIDLKAASIWTKMIALYPFAGGSASTHKYNLKDPRDLDAAYRITFNGSFTQNANGITPGGTSADYADTHLNGSVVLDKLNSHWSFYSRTNVDNAISDYGDTSGGEVLTTLGGTFYGDIPSSTDRASGAVANSLGLFSGSLGASNVTIYRNGTSVASKGSAATVNYGNDNMVFCSGYIGLTRPSTRNLAFGSIGLALTGGEMTSLYTAVQAFETALARSV